MRERNRTQNFPASYVGRGSYEPYRRANNITIS